MSKYYAVKVGLKPGIYQTWSECSKQVTGFPGAVHKSFSKLELAQEFLAASNSKSKVSGIDKEQTPVDYYHYSIYTDGSCINQRSSWTYLVIDPS